MGTLALTTQNYLFSAKVGNLDFHPVYFNYYIMVCSYSHRSEQRSIRYFRKCFEHSLPFDGYCSVDFGVTNIFDLSARKLWPRLELALGGGYSFDSFRRYLFVCYHLIAFFSFRTRKPSS